MESIFQYIKYPIWTVWRYLIDFKLAIRNTVIILDVFRRTAAVGLKANKVLKDNFYRWSVRTRGRYIWKVVRKVWAGWILDRARVSVEVIGCDKVDWTTNYIVASNHQSTLDIMLVIANVPNGRYVAKIEVLRFPFVGDAAAYGGQIIVDRNNREQAIASIRKGMNEWSDCNLIFFAEGTRTKTGELGKFKKGASHAAMETGFPILPVAISGAYEALGKGSLLRLRRNPKVKIEFGSPIPPNELNVSALTEKIRNTIKDMIENY